MERDKMKAIIRQQLSDIVDEGTTWRYLSLDSRDVRELSAWVFRNGGTDQDIYDTYVELRHEKVNVSKAPAQLQGK